MWPTDNGVQDERRDNQVMLQLHYLPGSVIQVVEEPRLTADSDFSEARHREAWLYLPVVMR